MGVFEDYEKAVWDVEHDNCTLGELEEAEQRLKDSIVDWHPYPQEKPIDGFGNNYLVTIRYGEKHYVDIGWHDEFGWHKYHIEANHIYGVTAWAELPKPYEEGAEE